MDSLTLETRFLARGLTLEAQLRERCFLALGAFIVDKVYRRHIRKRWAIACLIASSVASAVATPVVGWLAHDKPPWHVLGGEAALAIGIVTGWMIVAAGAGFVIFALLFSWLRDSPEAKVI
jgi:hypothetical protein